MRKINPNKRALPPIIHESTQMPPIGSYKIAMPASIDMIPENTYSSSPLINRWMRTAVVISRTPMAIIQMAI